MIKHMGTVELFTERLKLRKVKIEDANTLFNIWYGDELATKYMAWAPHKTVEETIDATKKWVEKSVQKETYHWIVEDKTGQIIGGVDVFYVNDKDEKAEIGYFAGRQFWGQGYVSEAVQAVLKFMLCEVGINRIEAYHSVNNAASGRVLQKSGMTHEGHFRQYYKTKFGFEDCDFYAIISSDIA